MEQTGIMRMDAYESCKQRDGSARVAATVSKSTSFGADKVSFTISLACDQNEQAINFTGDLAFKKALEMVGEGFAFIEAADRLVAEGQGVT